MEPDAPRLLARNGEPAPWQLSRGDARWDGYPRDALPTARAADAARPLGTGIGRAPLRQLYVRSGNSSGTGGMGVAAAIAWAVFPGRA
jgi:hypothetical protein